MDHFINDIGPRPFGSWANANRSVSYLVQEVERIRASTGAEISYYVDERPGHWLDGSYLRLWDRMPNVVVTLKGTGPANAKNALLISAHYDTVTLSPGATDNTLAVSCLIEALEVLSHSAKGRRDLIIAFVNGEESGLLGARHMTTDPTSFPNVGTFINIDGTPGDKSILFRSTGGWMDYVYGAVPRPLGFVIGQDIFNLGLIHSDTDWSVYKTERAGLDWATFSHRQSYHTQEDDHIISGVPQYLGDNIVAIALRIIGLEQNSELERKSKIEEPHVYFSFLNAGFAVYSMTASLAIHITITVVLFITLVVVIAHRLIRWKDAFQFAAAPPLRILGIGFLFNFGTLVFMIIIAIGGGMFSFFIARYFAWGSTEFGVWAFAFPAMAAFIFAQWVIMRIEQRFKIVVEISRLHLLWGHAVIILIILIASIFLSVRNVGSTYLIYLSFSTVFAQLIIHHLFYLWGYMSDDKSEYIPLASEEHMSLLSRNALGYGVTNSTIEEEEHIKTHRPKVDSKTTHFMWFIIFLVGVAPLLFLADILPLLFALVSGSVPSSAYAILVTIVVYFVGIPFMLTTRRAGHLGVVAIILTIAALAIFFSFTMVGRNDFHRRSPFSVNGNSYDGTLNIYAIQDFQPSTYDMLMKLTKANFDWIIKSHRTVSAAPVPLTVSSSIVGALQTNSTGYSATVTAAKSQYHIFSSPAPCAAFSLDINGQKVAWDPTLSSQPESTTATVFQLMLHNPTAIGNNSWTLNFAGQSGTYSVQSGWTEPDALTGFPALVKAFKDAGYISFMGQGTGFHWIQKFFTVPSV